MADAEFYLNKAACRAILRSKAAQQACLAPAERIRTRAASYGSGPYKCDVRPGKSRAHALVMTDGKHGARSNARHNSLYKALNGVGR